MKFETLAYVVTFYLSLNNIVEYLHKYVSLKAVLYTFYVKLVLFEYLPADFVIECVVLGVINTELLQGSKTGPQKLILLETRVKIFHGTPKSNPQFIFQGSNYNYSKNTS